MCHCRIEETRTPSQEHHSKGCRSLFVYHIFQLMTWREQDSTGKQHVAIKLLHWNPLFHISTPLFCDVCLRPCSIKESVDLSFMGNTCGNGFSSQSRQHGIGARGDWAVGIKSWWKARVETSLPTLRWNVYTVVDGTTPNFGGDLKGPW